MTRKKTNKPHAPRIPSKRLYFYAAEHGIEIKRQGQTWYYKDGEDWIQFGRINYLSLILLQVIAIRRKNEQP